MGNLATPIEMTDAKNSLMMAIILMIFRLPALAAKETVVTIGKEAPGIKRKSQKGDDVELS